MREKLEEAITEIFQRKPLSDQHNQEQLFLNLLKMQNSIPPSGVNPLLPIFNQPMNFGPMNNKTLPNANKKEANKSEVTAQPKASVKSSKGQIKKAESVSSVSTTKPITVTKTKSTNLVNTVNLNLLKAVESIETKKRKAPSQIEDDILNTKSLAKLVEAEEKLQLPLFNYQQKNVNEQIFDPTTSLGYEKESPWYSRNVKNEKFCYSKLKNARNSYLSSLLDIEKDKDLKIFLEEDENSKTFHETLKKPFV